MTWQWLLLVPVLVLVKVSQGVTNTPGVCLVVLAWMLFCRVPRGTIRRYTTTRVGDRTGLE